MDKVQAAAAVVDTARKSFDWTSKVMVAIYAALATTALIISAYFVVGAIKKRRVHSTVNTLPQVDPNAQPQQAP